jgi:O-antigen/teichoic acid export membrane protein
MGIILANIFFSVPLGLQLKDESNPFRSKENTSGSVPAAERFYSFSKQFFIYGFPMVGWFLGAQLLNIADRYFLQIFRSSEEVGIYSSNYNLVASAVSFVSTPLLTAAHPLLMNLGASISTHKKEAQVLITAFSRYFLIISFPILTYVLIFSKELTTIFLGLDYRRGNLILPIVLFGLLGWNFAMFGHKGLEFREKTRTMFIYVMICTAAKIILNFLFIPRYGYMGAAISTLICFYLYPLMVYFGTKSDIRWIIPWVSLTRVLTASIILAAAFMIFKMMHLDSLKILLMSGIIIFPLYFFVLLLLKEIKPYEIEFTKNYLRNGFRRIKGGP